MRDRRGKHGYWTLGTKVSLKKNCWFLLKHFMTLHPRHVNVYVEYNRLIIIMIHWISENKMNVTHNYIEFREKNKQKQTQAIRIVCFFFAAYCPLWIIGYNERELHKSAGGVCFFKYTRHIHTHTQKERWIVFLLFHFKMKSWLFFRGRDCSVFIWGQRWERRWIVT
jgi:hypothetical protein